MLKLLILSLIIIGTGIFLLSVKIIFRRNGYFPNTHIGGNKHLQNRGIFCQNTQQREQDRHKNLFERAKEVENIK
ncbi:hypothetical protein HQ47_04505 [Porphyromonas macacae]|uniref:Uncharacterized protein n=1 Tax=Porphyromonas macacae TaxID=28115 RepID=A0A0A2E623_9PORP|nr:hypothetical protein HQ47_04505 [Porphyromonas macacae]SUB88710.1 Uncharacterised protein [Porphyromonas macacae]